MPLRCCSEHPELGRSFLRVGGAVPVVLNWGPVVMRKVEGVPDWRGTPLVFPLGLTVMI